MLQDSWNERLTWNTHPQHILVIKRLGESTREPFIEILNFLIHVCNLNIYIEESEYESDYLRIEENLLDSEGKSFNCNLDKICEKNKSLIELIICLGGDGTLLHVSSMFQNKCPPVLSINFGSVGFLCPFEFENYQSCIKAALCGGVPIISRGRLNCRLEKLNDFDDSFTIDCKKETTFVNEHTCLNEIVVYRGSNVYLCNLDIYVNDHYVTTVQGDGLLISTPTGSTAYSMSTGGSLCHPSVQSITISCICPHSLSYRPIILPFDVDIKICLSPESRGTAFFSIDGRNMDELKEGYFLVIQRSLHHIPTLSRFDQVRDWFDSLSTCLNWNQRQKQRPLNKSECIYKPPFLTKTSSTNDFKSCYLRVPSVDQGYISHKYDDSDYQL